MLPILYQSPSFILYSYPLLMGLGWGVAFQIFFALVPSNLSKRETQILFWGMFLCAWIGAKAFFLYTVPKIQSDQLFGQVSFWTGGGFVFYGGFIGAAAFVGIYHLLIKKLIPETFWAMVCALTFGHAIGRLGCLMAGCCFGRETNLFWAIHLHGADRYPTQLLEALGLFFIGAHLLKAQVSKFKLICHYLIGYGVLRFFIEYLRGDIVRGQWWIFTPSQWMSLVMIIIGLVLTFRPFFIRSPDSHIKT